MDQAALLTILGNLYDKLVADVAERVQQQLNADSLRSDWIDSRIQTWADNNVDDLIENWAGSNVDDLIENWVQDNLDLEQAVGEAVENSAELADLIRTTVKNNLTFTVSVD